MNLKTYREKKGKTQKEVAEVLGITIPYYSDIERGVFPAGRKLAQDIVEWSEGQIKFDDLWPPD